MGYQGEARPAQLGSRLPDRLTMTNHEITPAIDETLEALAIELVDCGISRYDLADTLQKISRETGVPLAAIDLLFEEKINTI
jgi:hypothetical protein